jgi:hypothetical protein
MSRKFNYEFVKMFFASKGCELLDTNYKNPSQPLSYICKCGKLTKARFSSFHKSGRCVSCGNDKRRLSLEYVKTFFESNGCVLLEEKYKSARQLLQYKCKCGRISRINFRNFRKGSRCRSCGNNEKYTIDFVRASIEKDGYTLLTDSYQQTTAKMPVRCPVGHEYSTQWRNWQMGHRCRACYRIKQRGGLSDEEYKKRLKFKNRVSNMLHRVLDKYNQTKQDRTHHILGYSYIELMNHITSHPKWNKVKDKKWDIDHIFPIAAFSDYNIEDIKLINCLENLQPMTKSGNASKRDKYNHKKFEKWLEQKGVVYQVFP